MVMGVIGCGLSRVVLGMGWCHYNKKDAGLTRNFTQAICEGLKASFMDEQVPPMDGVCDEAYPPGEVCLAQHESRLAPHDR
ncbi:hypothetical protein CCAX7_35870 [Capsulimonas corticalis]|uniref:Uncharacterized protein n=1 Tax=Capsulimonas corticalis TaxID=2219043 RepID=A0A9N7QC80_9BACT|nr:hypothetical protein CCAX7_35870 [Capsulimonas corticalis]